MNEEVFQFQIALLNPERSVWRRFQVYGDIPFEHFHHIIRVVLGLQVNHPYEFNFKKYSILTPGTEVSPMDKAIYMYGDEVRLSEMLSRTGQKFKYIYDLADNLVHDVLFEKRLPVDPLRIYPLCIGGEGACPRGVSGMPGDLHPGAFNLREINNRLKRGPVFKLSDDFIIEERVDHYVEMAEAPFSIDDCLKKLKVKKTKESEEKIHELIATGGEVILVNDRFYPKVSFLKDFVIRVMPTEFELDRGILIPGHRLLPFLPVYVLSDEVEFIDKNGILEEKDIYLSVADLDTYFGLLDSNDLPIIDTGLRLDGEHRVTFMAVDLARFYKEHHFRPGDSLILKMENFADCICSIHYDPLSSIKAHEKEIRAWDDLFIATLKKVLRENIEMSYLQKQLLYTYYYMSRAMTREQKEIPGTEVGVLLRRTKEIAYSEPEDTGKIFHFGGKVVVEVSHTDS
ncbi:MAG: plasmid pRiA4b ORF-3 family protein [bacterium]|nr:plasmid pRiA4b ORF-3 family protein [bacterium]